MQEKRNYDNMKKPEIMPQTSSTTNRNIPLPVLSEDGLGLLQLGLMVNSHLSS